MKNSAIKKQTLKVKMVKIPLGDALLIKPLLQNFRIPTRGDLERIDQIIAVCDSVEKTRSAAVEEFKKEKDIDLNTDITEHHIHYKEFYKKMSDIKIELNPTALARFTKEELDIAIEGIHFTYAQRKKLDEYLVTPLK